MQAYRVHRLHTWAAGNPCQAGVPVARSCTAWISAACPGAVQPGEPAGGDVAGVPVQVRQRVAPGLAVLGQVVVVPAVGLADRQPGVDQRQHRDAGFTVLGEQQIQQRLRRRPVRPG